MQAEANSLASCGPGRDRLGTGARQRNRPVGGLAKGTPLNTAIWFSASAQAPWSCSPLASTTGSAGSCLEQAVVIEMVITIKIMVEVK